MARAIGTAIRVITIPNCSEFNMGCQMRSMIGALSINVTPKFPTMAPLNHSRNRTGAGLSKPNSRRMTSISLAVIASKSSSVRKTSSASPGRTSVAMKTSRAQSNRVRSESDRRRSIAVSITHPPESP